jgi:hypothetical protein
MGSHDRRTPVLIVAVVLVMLPATSGCLSEDEPQDLDDWFVAFTVDRFDPNGQRAVNVSFLLFEVRVGGMYKDTWMVQESDGFTKGDESVFPIRVEARYDDGVHAVEGFPILGSDPFMTGALFIRDGKMSVDIDGDDDLITLNRDIDRYDHDHELTVYLEGDYGTLRLYFNLNEPPSP